MTEQTINELTNFFRTFKQGETKQATQSNLTFDDAVKYFFIFQMFLTEIYFQKLYTASFYCKTLHH